MSSKRPAKYSYKKGPNWLGRNRAGVEPGDNTFPGCEINEEQWEFIRAMHYWQLENGRWPKAADVLAVAKALGYRKVV